MWEKQRHSAVNKLIAVLAMLIAITNGRPHVPQPYPYSKNGFRNDSIRLPANTPSVTVTKHWNTGCGDSYANCQPCKTTLNEVSFPHLNRNATVKRFESFVRAFVFTGWFIGLFLFEECVNSWKKINTQSAASFTIIVNYKSPQTTPRAQAYGHATWVMRTNYMGRIVFARM